MIRCFLSLISACFVFVSAIGQSNFIGSIDQNLRFPENFYRGVENKSFFDKNYPDKKINFSEFDHNLFNATVYFLINRERAEKGAADLEYLTAFESVAYHYFNYYSRDDLARFASGNLKQENLHEALSVFNFNGAYAKMLTATTITGSESTYLSLASEFVLNFKYSNPEILHHKAFSNLGVRANVDQTASHLTIMLIFGGYRLSWIQK